MGLKGLKSEFTRMQKEYEKDDKVRDQVIVLSREVIKPSKLAIYALHRSDITQAKSHLALAQKNIASINKLLHNYGAKDIGAYQAALEEYVEAQCYLTFLETNTIPTAKDLGVNASTYLLGLSDCTGELARRAVQLAIEGKTKEIEHIHEVLTELSELFLHIEFRGIDMRKKLEGLKYNVTKTQNILYDISMKQK